MLSGCPASHHLADARSMLRPADFHPFQSHWIRKLQLPGLHSLHARAYSRMEKAQAAI